MASALLVSNQHAYWNVLAPPLSAIAALDESVAQKALTASPTFQREVWSLSPTPSLTNSPFEYQRAILHAAWIPTAKVHFTVRQNPRIAHEALEQIRVLYHKQVGRRREQAEAEWIATNRMRYAGQWVALLGGELIAAGQSARAVAKIAAEAPSTPLIIFIEKELPFAGW